MRKLALSLLLLIISNAAFANACRAEEAAPQPAAAPDAVRAAKAKKSKPAKTDAASPAAPAAANNDNLSPEQIIDMYTSKNPPPAPSSSVSSDPLPASVPIPPAADSGDSSASPSIPPPSFANDSPSGTDSQSGSDSSSGGNDDQPVIGERTIPEKTLKAGELNNAAIDALNNKEFKKAIDLLNQALAADRDYTQGRSNLRVAYFNYGVEMYNNGKYAEAIPLLEIALDLSKQLGKDQSQIKELYDECKKAVKETSNK